MTRVGTWLLLRGLTRESGHWGPFRDVLAAQLAPAGIACLDLPGAGHRWAERSPGRLADITDDLRGRAQALPRPLRVLGLSMGGMIAIDWMTRHPEDLAGALLVNTSVRPWATTRERLRPAAWPGLLRVLAGGDAQAVEATVLRWTSARPADHVGQEAAWVRLRQAHPVSRSNALRQLLAAARYTAPENPPAPRLRILCSARDRLVDPVCSQRLAAAWNVPLDCHPDAGHDLPLDAPDWVAAQAALLDASVRTEASRGRSPAQSRSPSTDVERPRWL